MMDKPTGITRKKYLCNYVQMDLDYFVAACNFTDTELGVFKMLSRGRSAVYTGIELGMSERTVYNVLGKIWDKIERVI